MKLSTGFDGRNFTVGLAITHPVTTLCPEHRQAEIYHGAVLFFFCWSIGLRWRTDRALTDIERGQLDQHAFLAQSVIRHAVGHPTVPRARA